MPTAVPLATYRLQLSARFGFAQAAAIVPYLKALGISHLYVSPFLRHAMAPRMATTWSITTRSTGARRRRGLQQLSAALAEADIGLILDFVPNHMGVHYDDNVWWLDVLKWGRASPTRILRHRLVPARASPAGGVLLPILGTSYGEALERGDIELRYDAAEGSFSAWYYEHRCRSRRALWRDPREGGLRGVCKGPARRLAADRACRALPRPAQSAARESIRAQDRARGIEGAQAIIARGLEAYRPAIGGLAAALSLHGLLERQHYRLAHWRLSASDINYRRFFDINSLAGLRVEDTRTFAAIHRLVARLIAEAACTGCGSITSTDCAIRSNICSDCNGSSAACVPRSGQVLYRGGEDSRRARASAKLHRGCRHNGL